MVPNRSHVLVLVSVFYVGKCYEKIRKDHVILLAPLKVMSQNHKKHNLLSLLHPNIHKYPKDQMPGSKHPERPAVIKKFGSNCHVICQASKDIFDQSSAFLYGCNFGEVIWYSAQINLF